MTSVDVEREELEAIVHTALEFGVRVQMSGGYTERVRESTQHVARAIGAERAECTVSATSVGLTAHRGGRSHTALRRTPAIGVNFSELSELSRLTSAVDGMSCAEVAERLERIESRHRRYPTWLVVVMLGVACASMSLIFGADPAGAALAGVAGLTGAALREGMSRQRFKPFVFTLFAAFVSGTIVLVLHGLTATPTPAAAASVLYLIPGVPLLNGTADLVTANYLNGIVRLTMGSVILLAAALGLTVALGLWARL